MKKKRIGILLCAAMTISMLSGCGDSAPEQTGGDSARAESGESSAEEESASGSSQESTAQAEGKSSLWLLGDQDSATLSMVIPVGVTDKEPTDMWFFKYYEEMTGVHMDVTGILAADWGDKKTIMMASGEYPGIIWSGGWSTKEMTEYSQNGTFLDLTDYIQYMPNYKREMDKMEGSWRYVTSPDGGMYSLAAVNPANYDSLMRMWINRKWLDNVEMDAPETVDELYQVLKAFKEKDADGDGDTANEIPLCGYFGTNGTNVRTTMLNAFGFDTKGELDFNVGLESWNGNQVVYMPLTERYKEYLAYMKKLMEEGLMDQDMFSQDQAQFQAKAAEGRGGVLGAGSFLDTTAEGDYEAYERLIPKYDESSEKVVAHADSVRYGSVVITDKCEDPVLAAKWIDMFYTPENAFNFQSGPIIIEHADGTVESRTEGISENPNVGCHVQVDENGKYLAVSFPGVDIPELNPDKLGAWDWLCLEHPANAMFNSTIGEYYFYGQLFEGFPGNVEEEIAYEFSRYENEEADFSNRSIGYTRGSDVRESAPYWRSGYPTVYPSVEQQEWLDEHKKILEDYVLQMEAKFITGAADLDKEYDAYIQELKNKGAEEYQKIYVELYNK